MRDEFALVQTLRGAIYGRVALVRHRATDAIYAMKMMSLAHMAMQRAVCGPVVREDGNTELRVLRRISGNRVMVLQGGFEQEQRDGDVDRSSYSVHPLWEAWGQPHHTRDDGGGSYDHHNLLILHTDFVDTRANARCLVFDYCPYGELYDQLQKTPSRTLGVETARVFFLQIATAVRFIHTHNIAHRDVSLENVLIDTNRQCRLGDFGLSCEFGTMCSGRVGKAFYMAPEVYAWQPGELYNGLKADLWSLGIVLFIMVTGAPPVEVPSEKDARFRVIQSKGIGELLAMWKLDTKLPFELCDLLRMLLTVDPEDRVDIEGVWMHPWLLDPVDAQALAMEGKFSECMVGVGHEPTEGEASGVESDDTDANEAEDAAGRREPQEEVEAEAPCGVSVVKAKRGRKRIKIAIEDAPGDAIGSSTLTGRVAGFFGGPAFDADFLACVGLPPPLRHESLSGGEASPDGAYRSVLEPVTSPMVWPKVGVKAALRSLFPPKEVEDLEEMASGDAEEKREVDASDSSRVSGLSRRRPRLDSSSSCSSYSSASSTSNCTRKRDCNVDGDDAETSHHHEGASALCRFCLRWVTADQCANRVTLPTQSPAKSLLRAAQSKTRRVCDACFVAISAAFARAGSGDSERPWPVGGAAHVA